MQNMGAYFRIKKPTICATVSTTTMHILPTSRNEGKWLNHAVIPKGGIMMKRALLLFLLCAMGATAQVVTNGGHKIMLFGGEDHKVYLGCLSCNEYASDSVLNRYGDHGSRYSDTSIFNKYGDYGSRYS